MEWRRVAASWRYWTRVVTSPGRGAGQVPTLETGIFAVVNVEPVSGFEPLTVRLQGRFTLAAQLLRHCSASVRSSSWCRSMSLGSPRFGHAAGTFSWLTA